MSTVNLIYIEDEELGYIDNKSLKIGDWILLTSLDSGEEFICVVSKIDLKFTLIRIQQTYAHNLIQVKEFSADPLDYSKLKIELSLDDIKRIVSCNNKIIYVYRKINVDINIYYSTKT